MWLFNLDFICEELINNFIYTFKIRRSTIYTKYYQKKTMKLTQ